MTSSLDISTIDKDNFNTNDKSERSVDFEDHILRLYAQEIEENQINEIIEAQLQNISINSNCLTAKEIIKKYNLSQRKPIPPPKWTISSKKIPGSMESQISELKNKVLHIKQSISEETREKNNSNQTKSNLNKNLGAIPKSAFSYHNKESLSINTKTKQLQPEKETKNSIESLIFNSIADPDIILKTVSCTTRFSQSPSTVTETTPFKSKETGELLSGISNSFLIPKTSNVDIVQSIKKSDDNGYIGLAESLLAITPPSLPSRPPPVHKYTPDTFSKRVETSIKNMNPTYSILEQSENSFTQRNEPSTGIHSKRNNSNKEKGFSSAAAKNVVQLPYPFTDQIDENKVRVSQTQISSAIATAEEASKSLKLVNFSQKMNNESEIFVPEKSKKVRTNDINIYENQNASFLFGDTRKIIMKPEIPKKPPKQTIQKRIEQILNQQLNNSGQMQIQKQNYEATKLQKDIPSNNVTFDTETHSNFSNTDSLKTEMKITDGRIAEITFFDKDKIRKIIGQNNSSEHKGSLNFEEKISNGVSVFHEKIDGQKVKQRKTSQENLIDLDTIFDSITRPELPQKLRTTQRSVSYSSLVQSFKDLSVALWNPPPDKVKRCSIGDILITNENKDIESGYTAPLTRNKQSVSSNEDDNNFRSRSMSDTGRGAINRFSWFHDVKISEANQRLLELGQDGAFLIRPSSKPTVDIPYTASVIHSRKIFNIHIRHKADRQYAIGKEKKAEKTFPSVSELVKYHQDVPFEICLPTNTLHNVYFRVTPPR